MNERIAGINKRLSEIESAAAFLDKKLLKKLVVQRRCMLMDSMPLDDRRISLAFGNAVAAIEGLPVSANTEIGLISWADGKTGFRESYHRVLRAYNLAEV